MKINSIVLFAASVLLAVTLQSCYVAQPVPVQQVEVVPPPWAPPYQNVPQVQYYYMPDIEVYYDVWHHEYVYLDRGSWQFAPALPPMYADYDMNNAYVVVLDSRVHQPWMHHELYVSHYPRYYYHNVYQTNENNYGPRGFNENGSAPIYEHPRTSPANSNQGGTAPPPASNPSTPGRPLQANPGHNTPNSDPHLPPPSGHTMPGGTVPPPQTQPHATPGSNESHGQPAEHGTQPGARPQEGQPQPGGTLQRPPAEHTAPQGRPMQGGQSEPHAAPQRPAGIETQGRTQPVRYMEKSVGQPVKVRRDMVKPKEVPKGKDTSGK